ncbi:uncharacterized protein NEMAJ01_0270 [Nematocida major]|uniref:uncharacterized protein n=1 Tax=Nematocida major TaxID=1912982 RepID=UPI002007D085|nr:uncharacterized protein NEMAJ01_0270 [Nematocida major]KAH9385374.1 hypothetical protein NEMAJ01_0270 [Nematocida major]
MDALFSQELALLVSALEEARLQDAEKAARKLDIIYKVSTDGFEPVNINLSKSLHEIMYSLLSETEEKELLIRECRETVENKNMHNISEILKYSKNLAEVKCPLLWSEDMPLDRIPAYPTDSLVQHSLLRGKQIHEEKK